LWPAEASHLAIADVADWFSAHAYVPKLRDRVVLETSIREAIGKFDAQFGYADRFDPATGAYVGLIYAKAAPETFPPTALLVRAEVLAKEKLVPAAVSTSLGDPMSPGFGEAARRVTVGPTSSALPPQPAKPRRFYGSVEIDMNRPVKAFDAILNAVVMELQQPWR